MAAIEAVFIVDINARLILNYPVTSTPPDVESLIKKVIKPQVNGLLVSKLEIPPVVEISSSRIVYSQRHGNAVFMLSCSSTTPALLPFEFINRVVEVLEEYLSPPLLPIKIESNYDTVTLILNEMIDGGYPYMTYSDPMRDLVPYGGLLRKLLSGNSTPSQVSDIPWRRANVRHTHNELFIDLVETIYSIVPGSQAYGGGLGDVGKVSSASAFYSSASSNAVGGLGGKPILSRVEGNIFSTSNLSGIPEIQLILDMHNQKIQYPSFHQCIRLPTWQQNPGTLSFTPPDGRSLLASYTLDNVSNKGGIVFASLKTGLGMQKNEFEARVWTVMSRTVKHVDGLYVTLECGNGVRNLHNLRITAGDFHMGDEGVGEWRLPGKTPLGWSATLRGSVKENTSEESEEGGNELNGTGNPIDTSQIKFPTHLSLKYSLTGAVFSGITVQTLKIVSIRGVSDSVKPYKGVRYMTNVGEYIVRR